MSKGILRFGLYGILIVILCASSGLSTQIPESEPTEQQLIGGKPIIFKLKPERKDGRGYKLIYS